MSLLLSLRKFFQPKTTWLRSILKLLEPKHDKAMKLSEKIQWFVLPSLLIIGIGILEIKYPHALSNFDDGYTGHGIAGFIMLLIELFLMLTWGKIEGIFLIILGIIAIVICFLPKKQQASESSVIENIKNSSTTMLSSAAFNVGKAYLQRKVRNKKSGINS
jgi:uncharacterized membrane protein